MIADFSETPYTSQMIADFSETPYTSQMIADFLKHLIHLK